MAIKYVSKTKNIDRDGGGLAFSLPTLYSDDPSLNPDEPYCSFFITLLEKNENNPKVAGYGPFLKIS